CVRLVVVFTTGFDFW
nr:immunoglobulin heavy chain junction region [Macaca mulatta]MOW92343.1 immunoglobulin heavy chain junction region [Macaca mulatta]